MPIDLAQLSENAYTLNAVTNLILVRPQVNNGYRAQIGTTLDTPILFNYEVDNKASLESDITDYFVEDNTAINDQISLKPEIVTVRGLVGELNNVAPSFLSGIAETARDRLTNIGAYAPELSLTAQRAYNLAFQAYQLANNSLQNINATLDSAFDLSNDTVIGSDGIEENRLQGRSQTQQQIYFRKFYTYWRNRTLFTIQTPWAIFKNMAIQKLTAIQDGESDLISDFEIQFKIIRFSQTLNSNLSFEGRSLTQAASVVNNGSTSGVPV
jgi:hypothetical protein